MKMSWRRSVKRFCGIKSGKMKEPYRRKTAREAEAAPVEEIEKRIKTKIVKDHVRENVAGARSRAAASVGQENASANVSEIVIATVSAEIATSVIAIGRIKGSGAEAVETTGAGVGAVDVSHREGDAASLKGRGSEVQGAAVVLVTVTRVRVITDLTTDLTTDLITADLAIKTKTGLQRRRHLHLHWMRLLQARLLLLR